MPSGSNFMSEANKVESRDARLVRPYSVPELVEGPEWMVRCLLNASHFVFFCIGSA